ncbi:MAG: outer membrane beta-barrel protein [Cellulophaga sp.]
MKIITSTKYIKKTIFLSLALTSTIISAQDTDKETKPKLSISGTVDAYYRTNLSAPNDENAIIPGSSFANLNGFSLGMANIIASYDGKKTGFVADLVFGPRGEDAVFNSPLYTSIGGSSQIINQLYAYWNITDDIKITLGNFNTFLGYEVISPIANFNYSTSYLFSYGPFSHTGLKIDIVLSDDFSLMLTVMNPTDLTEFNPSSKYAFGAQLGYSNQYLNFLYDAGGFEIDYTGGFDLTEDFFLGINVAYFDNDGNGFAGAVLYPQYITSDNFTLGLRGEFFAQNGNFDAALGTGVIDSSIFTATLTGSYTIENLTIKPEIRLDSASDNAFINADLAPSKNLSSFLLAAIYSF